MASVAPQEPVNGTFPDGRALHYKVEPSRKEAAEGLKKKVYPTRTAAENAIREFERDRDRAGRVVDRSDPTTYAEWVPVWEKALEARNLKPRALAAYKRDGRTIVRELGNRRILSVGDAEVAEFTAAMLGRKDHVAGCGRQPGCACEQITVSYIRGIRNRAADMVDLWRKRKHPLPVDGDGTPINASCSNWIR